MKITSLKNPTIKTILKLKESRFRRELGLIIVAGERDVLMALRANVEIEGVFICPSLLAEEDCHRLLGKVTSVNIPISEITEKIASKISYGQKQEGIVALCKRPNRELRDLKIKKNPLYLIVENIEKPGNLGAILRTCDAAAVDGLLFCDAQTDIYNPNVIRSSLGAVFTVNVVPVDNTQALSFMRKRQINICATTPFCENIHTKADLKGPLALVFGSEKEGLSDFWLKQADFKMKIPMFGSVDSLNVSVSAAIVLYEAIRQRRYG